MAHRNRKVGEEMVQGTLLLDDPGFLREIVGRVLQEMLEAEMAEHVGAAPYERSEGRKGHRNSHKLRLVSSDPRKNHATGGLPPHAGPTARFRHSVFSSHL